MTATCPQAAEAYICTFECTFCPDCTKDTLRHVCPNCGGNLVLRPVRPAAKLAKNPPATVRVLRDKPCGPKT